MDKTALCWKVFRDDLSQHSVNKEMKTQRVKMFQHHNPDIYVS